MTVPTGSPDGQAGTQQHGQVIIGRFLQPIAAGNTTLFSGASAAWASFQVRFTIQSFGAILTIEWFNDTALTQGVGTDTWNITHLTGLAMLYPVQAPFCRIHVTNDQTTAAITGTIYVIGTQINAERIRYIVTAQTVEQVAQTLLASASIAYHPAFIASGLATLTFTPTDALGKLSVSLFAEDEAFNHTGILYSNAGPTGQVVVQVSIPDAPLGVNIVNTDAGGPHSFGVTLVIPPD